MPRDVGDRPLLSGKRWGEEGRVNARWKTKRTGVIIQRRKFLDRSTIMGTFGFMVFVAYRTENVFIFLLFLNGVLL